MDWGDSADQATFRADVAGFIESRLPAYYRRLAEQGDQGDWQTDRFLGDDEAKAAAAEWEAAVAERGWVAPHWPQEYGGAGMSSMEHFILNEEMSKAGAPQVGGQGVAMLGPTLIVHGTDEQKTKFLTSTLNGDIAWAQGYSEPSAGSDLASLQTRAIRDGDEWVVNGQKIWTSNAHRADWIFALVRTDPDAPKHRGISFILMDMATPGISVRPLISGGWKHFSNETFYEDVRVPASQVVGEVNRGWYVGMTLLDYERSSIGGAVEMERQLMAAIDYIHDDEGATKSRVDELPTVRSEIADRYIEIQVSFNLSFRIASMQASGLIPNMEASMGKVFSSEVSQRVHRTGTRMFGLYSNVWDEESEYSPYRSRFTQNYFHRIPATIAGGTSEIQRNIIATRGLGLPRG